MKIRIYILVVRTLAVLTVCIQVSQSLHVLGFFPFKFSFLKSYPLPPWFKTFWKNWTWKPEDRNYKGIHPSNEWINTFIWAYLEYNFAEIHLLMLLNGCHDEPTRNSYIDNYCILYSNYLYTKTNISDSKSMFLSLDFYMNSRTHLALFTSLVAQQLFTISDMFLSLPASQTFHGHWVSCLFAIQWGAIPAQSQLCRHIHNLYIWTEMKFCGDGNSSCLCGNPSKMNLACVTEPASWDCYWDTRYI